VARERDQGPGLRREGPVPPAALTLVAIAALGMAIGLDISVYTGVTALLLRLWPVHDPERVVSVDGGFSIAEARYAGTARACVERGHRETAGGHAARRTAVSHDADERRLLRRARHCHAARSRVPARLRTIPATRSP
jgi:hypothetical protein